MDTKLHRQQVLHEIAMSIGASLDMIAMLKTCLPVLLRRLGCTMVSVIEADAAGARPIYTMPHMAGATVLTPGLAEALTALRSNPVLCLQGGEHPRYLWRLADFGALLLARGKAFDENMERELVPLANKLAVALRACRQFARLHADIAERKRLERELTQARDAAEAGSRAKSEFLAHMSHELRTPLNAVLGFSQLLAADETLPAAARGQVGEIGVAGRHLLCLVEDVMDLAHIEAGRMTLCLEAVPVAEVLAEARRLAEPHAAACGVSFYETQGVRDVAGAWVSADWQRLRQAVLSLLSNAIKYNRPGGHVALSCGRTDGRARIAVADTGPGIAPDKQARLFTAFDRLGMECGSIGGTGIGLVIARRFVEAMGGSIGFSSVPGVGSRFWIDLPLGDEPAASATDAAARLGAHILVVEDHPALQEALQGALESFGYRVTPADDGLMALDALDRDDFDLVLMDCQMPRLDGYAATAEIRRREAGSGRHIPVVAVTANVMTGAREKCLAAGMDDYLTKPFDFARLAATLVRWLDGGAGVAARTQEP